MNKPLEIYASVILHSGCALTSNNHKWIECPNKEFYRKLARKHQIKLNSNGVAVGKWIKAKEAEKIIDIVREREGDYLVILEDYLNVESLASSLD